MVMARLHVICGNCGSNNDFEYEHGESFIGCDDEQLQWKTAIICRNCATRHQLDDNAENMNPKKDVDRADE